MYTKVLKWINTAAFTAMIAVNALANLLPLGGRSTGQVSAAYPNLFTPAPVTFSIWGVIYLFLGLFVVYQWGILDDGKYSNGVRSEIGAAFAMSCVLNIAWIFLWHYDRIGASVACMAMLLVMLALIETCIEVVEGDFLTTLAVRVPFDIYFGWIIAATIANVSVWLTKTGWSGFGISDTVWTILMVLIGALIAFAVAIIGRKWLSAAAVMWAYTGILIRHVSLSGYAGAYRLVIAAVITGLAIMLSGIILNAMGERMTRRAKITAGRVG